MATLPEGVDQNAFDLLKDAFDQYGLGALWEDAVVPLLQRGITQQEALELNLRENPIYKERFKGNEARIKAGLPALTIGQYVGLEQQYKNMMQAAGLPKGFYDEPDDFTKWIENDVMPEEAQTRVVEARKWVDTIDPAVRRTMLEYYGVDSDSLTAYALDPERATSVIEQAYNTAVFKGTASNFDVNVGRDTAELAASKGVSQQEAEAGFAQIAQEKQPAKKLGDIYGDRLSEDDLVAEKFNFANSAEVTAKKKRLSALEQAQFSGSAAIGRDSLRRKKQQGL